LVRAAESAGLDVGELRKRFPRRLLRERVGDIHYVISIHDAPGGARLAFVKGAPEQVVRLCDLDAAARAKYLVRNDELAAAGLRVLALAWKPLGGDGDASRGYRWIGLVGLRDPLRPTARDAVRSAKRAGIRTVILTGDQLRTADAIARQVELGGIAVDGSALARRLEAGDHEAEALLDRVGVLARVSPADKAAIVRAFRRRGEIVAMVGDGINDAPALKIADVGVAVGVGSSDLARQVADVVLAEEDLRAILAAVGEGRIVQDNLRRAIRFLFATNLSEMALMVASSLLGGREPLTPMQLLWINLLTDTLPALALALEPGHPEVLDRPPAPPQAPLLSHAAVKEMVRDGALMATVGAGGMLLGGPRLAFATLTSAQLSYATVCRAPGTSMNRRFLGLVGGAIAVQGAALVTSPLRRLLRLGPLSALEPVGFLAGLVLPPMIAGARASGEIVRRAPKEVRA
jgi:Ca2+-transporting ATPase